VNTIGRTFLGLRQEEAPPGGAVERSGDVDRRSEARARADAQHGLLRAGQTKQMADGVGDAVAVTSRYPMSVSAVKLPSSWLTVEREAALDRRVVRRARQREVGRAEAAAGAEVGHVLEPVGVGRVRRAHADAGDAVDEPVAVDVLQSAVFERLLPHVGVP